MICRDTGLRSSNQAITMRKFGAALLHFHLLRSREEVEKTPSPKLRPGWGYLRIVITNMLSAFEISADYDCLW